MLHLHTLWFIVLAILWVGFFVLEGFDFGVGMLHMFTGKTDTERRIALNAIGPFWDGNEVWLVVAGAGTFAAFPDWYATWFSALYLALVLVLIGLIARGVSFEYRGKRDDAAWRLRWSVAATVGSLLIPLVLGIGLGDLLAGLPIDKSQEFTGNFFDLLTPYGIWVGLTLVGLCLLHGCTFLKLKTTGAIRERARAAAKPLGWIALALALGFVIWTRAVVGDRQVPTPVEALALIATGFAARLAMSEEHDGWAFAASAIAIASVVGSIFIDLYPNVMVSSTNHAYNLTVSSAASGGYALKVMTIVVVLFLPVVLLYQGWSFHVFRGRLAGPPASPQPSAPEQPPAT